MARMTKAAPAPAKKAAKAPARKAVPAKKVKPSFPAKFLAQQEAALYVERATYTKQFESLRAEAASLVDDFESGDVQFDEESGEGDTINIERERDLLLSASAQQIVDEIDRALERIENKTYGLCLPAGRRISLERLEALPYAETCVDCKARAERRR